MLRIVKLWQKPSVGQHCYEKERYGQLGVFETCRNVDLELNAPYLLDANGEEYTR